VKQRYFISGHVFDLRWHQHADAGPPDRQTDDDLLYRIDALLEELDRTV
jgi:hypothetical protein